jgi:hypothetical protein
MRTRLVVHKFNAMQIGKLIGILYAGIGLLVGLLVAAMTFLGGLLQSITGTDLSAALGFGLGVAAIVALPVLYGIMGFLAGAIAALLFNFASSIVGGAVLEVESSS